MLVRISAGRLENWGDGRGGMSDGEEVDEGGEESLRRLVIMGLGNGSGSLVGRGGVRAYRKLR